MKDPFIDVLFTQQESDEGPQTGSEDDGDSDEEEFDCEFLVSITVCDFFLLICTLLRVVAFGLCLCI